MTDSLIVTNLRVDTKIGVTEKERAEPQTVLVSFEVFADLAAASRSDDLSQAVDYGTLVPQIAKLVERSENRLLEKLAGDIAGFVEAFGGVSRVTVEIAKVDPPLDEEVERVAVRIEREFA
jgi:FolB domain-containing protein